MLFCLFCELDTLYLVRTWFAFKFFLPTQVTDAVDTRHAAREMRPRLSKLTLQERLLGSWSATQSLAHAELHFSTQNRAHSSTGICTCSGKNKKTFLPSYRLPTDNFATALTLLLEQWMFWSNFTAVVSTLLLHCCNCDILCNTFTAFQEKEIFFLNSWLFLMEMCLGMLSFLSF